MQTGRILVAGKPRNMTEEAGYKSSGGIALPDELQNKSMIATWEKVSGGRVTQEENDCGVGGKAVVQNPLTHGWVDGERGFITRDSEVMRCVKVTPHGIMKHGKKSSSKGAVAEEGVRLVLEEQHMVVGDKEKSSRRIATSQVTERDGNTKRSSGRRWPQETLMGDALKSHPHGIARPKKWSGSRKEVVEEQHQIKMITRD